MNYRNKDWLFQEYILNNKSLPEIAKICEVVVSVVWYWVKKFEIKKEKLNRYTDSGEKICGDCKLTFHPSAFHKKPDSVDGLHHLCNSCFQEKYKILRENYRKRPEIKSKINKTSLDWIKNNKEKHNKNVRNHWQKIKNKPGVKINNSICSAINQSLQNGKNKRHWETLVGYTLEELKTHLESKFETWMNWNNYGRISHSRKTWQIDHILPVSSFTIDSAECDDFKKCWALENLRPLESFENLRKRDKIIDILSK